MYITTEKSMSARLWHTITIVGWTAIAHCASRWINDLPQWSSEVIPIQHRGLGGWTKEHFLCKSCCAHSFEGPGWSFVLCWGSPLWNKPCSTIWGVQECYTLCARLRRTNSGSDLGPSPAPSLVVYSCPINSWKKVPRSGIDPGTMWSWSRSVTQWAT